MEEHQWPERAVHHRVIQRGTNDFIQPAIKEAIDDYDTKRYKFNHGEYECVAPALEEYPELWWVIDWIQYIDDNGKWL
jgi:hypothetical protein